LRTPPNSSGLNPIKNFGAILKARVTAREPRDVETAKEYHFKEWYKIDYDVSVISLIHCMPDRIKAVIQSKGYPIKY